jgi:hypothetical protein
MIFLIVVNKKDAPATTVEDRSVGEIFLFFAPSPLEKTGVRWKKRRKGVVLKKLILITLRACVRTLNIHSLSLS